MSTEIAEKVAAATVEMAFKIRDERKAHFEHEMGKLIRRAERMGLTAPTYTFGAAEDTQEVHTEAVEDLMGRTKIVEIPIVVRRWNVMITGAAPKFEGWTLAATIQVLSGADGAGDAVIVRSITETPAPARFREVKTAGGCEHCRAARYRKDTFLVLHDDGTWKQVGRQCIRDFLGHKSPEDIARMAQFLLDARELGEDGGFGGGASSERWPIAHYLGYVAAVMHKFGWVSGKRAEEEGGQPTKATAHDHMAPSKELLKLQARGEWERLTPSEADVKRGTEALDWAKEISDSDATSSDYLYNLRTIAQVGTVEPRTLGYAASIIIAHDKALERVRARLARPESNYVGEVGKRQVFAVTQVKVIPLENQWGTSYLHIFTDAAGNDLKWFGSSRLGIYRGGGRYTDLADGETVEVKGTVKAHEEYKDRKQTLLSRCDVHVECPKTTKRNQKVAQALVDAFAAMVGDTSGRKATVAGVCESADTDTSFVNVDGRWVKEGTL